MNFRMISSIILFILYWWLLSWLTDVILETPRIKKIHWFFIGGINMILTFFAFETWNSAFLCYFIMIALLFLDLSIFYKDKFKGVLLCTLACSIHVLSVFTMVSGSFSILFNHDTSFLSVVITSFAALDSIILAAIRLVPLTKVKLMNQHKEQQWFIITWMAVNYIFLLYAANSSVSPAYQAAASFVVLLSLYIVLFFSFKTSAMLGYKEKNMELRQAIHQEQQFRNSLYKDALAFYEINVTQNIMIKGFEDQYDVLGDMIYRYSDMLIFMSRKLVYSQDINDMINHYQPSNMIRQFENGQSELSVEYRRLITDGSYAWVKAVINLAEDHDSKDIKAFVHIRNIDAEKKKQLELQRLAERDALTGLYNKSMTSKLIEEYLAFHQTPVHSAVFMIDVDDFKDINDHLGHIYGDAVLCELGQKLMHSFSSEDIVGRIGGDEFIVFIKERTSFEKVREKAKEICQIFHITYRGKHGEEYKISSSVGISFAPENGGCFKDLYSHADVALYAAKREGKNTYKFYDGQSFTGYTSNRTAIQTITGLSQKDAKPPSSLAPLDELTGCRTYYKFKEDAAHILKEQPDMPHFLVKLDIDKFKLINQIYGYEKGNEILCLVAKAIKKTTRNENEIFARVTNDEFIALFTIRENGDIEELYKNFLNHFQSFVGSSFAFKFSFPHGRYVVYPNSGQKMDIHDMFEKVNIAHKAAKQDKTLEFVFYDECITKEALRMKEIENKMDGALEHDEFAVYLQPKYYLDQERIGGAEALTRWENEAEDLFYPNAFIPVFERNGFIVKLDYYVFKKVCLIIKNWIDAGIDPVAVSVNFSMLHLGNKNFVAELCEIVDSVGISRKYLEIEITETVIYNHIETLEVLIEEIHESGFRISMDDFGSGYSSLGMLKNLAVDVIKIDKSFFAGLRDPKRAKIVVGSVIEMAGRLGIYTVAEGVEVQEQIDFLRELHCDMVQGFYFSRPLTIEAFTHLIKEKGKVK